LGSRTNLHCNYFIKPQREKLKNIISGQFIEEILKFDFVELAEDNWSFTYFIDYKAFECLKNEVLGRQIVVTNRHEWASEDILLAYRGQSKVEYAFRNLKNPYHLAIRPQYHWTDQKIATHFLICIIGYLLTTAIYTKARNKASYNKNMNNLMNELKNVRLACVSKKKSNKLKFQIETTSKAIQKLLSSLNVTDDNIRPKLNFSDYI
jgi:transposase